MTIPEMEEKRRFYLEMAAQCGLHSSGKQMATFMRGKAAAYEDMIYQTMREGKRDVSEKIRVGTG